MAKYLIEIAHGKRKYIRKKMMKEIVEKARPAQDTCLAAVWRTMRLGGGVG